MKVFTIYGDNNDKLDDFIVQNRSKASKLVDVRNATTEHIKSLLMVLNRNAVDGDIYIIFGKKKLGWWKFACKTFKDTAVLLVRVGPYSASELQELDYTTTFVVPTLKTNVIDLCAWEEAIEDSLNAIDMSLYTETLNWSKIKKEI